MVSIDPQRTAAFAEFFRTHREVQPFNFCGAHLPPAGAPGVVDFFFFCTAHQFGFWEEAQGRYARPMLARTSGRMLKGSDYLFACATRRWQSDPACFAPDRLRGVSEAEWNVAFADDEGRNPLPLWPDNLRIIRDYVRWFSQHATAPSDLLAAANRQPRPLAAFLATAGQIPGYREDPLQKKLQLLAIILENRPERFLRVTDPGSYRPIIDYHLQRSALRTGLVVVDDEPLRQRLMRREFVAEHEEKAVREAVFRVMDDLVKSSGSSVAAIDYFFFGNRTRCPEMSEPQCASCPVQAICSKQTALFQPVFRTTAY